MNLNTKGWLLRLSSLMIFLQSSWAVWLLTRTLLQHSSSLESLFLTPGIYLVEILLLAGFAALLPWLKIKQTPTWLLIISGIYSAFTFSDLWTVGYYLSPSLLLTLGNLFLLSPQKIRFSWRNILVFTGSGAAQFFFSLTPFLIRVIF